MARNISTLYDFYQYILRKERGVFQSPAQFTTNLDAGQLDCFEEWFKPYGANQEIHDALRPFRTYQPFTSSSAGFVTFPSDYLHLLGQPFTVTGSTVNRIDFLNEDELPFALTSQLRPVTTAYPVAVDTSTGFSIYPQSTQTGAYFYLRRPATPVYGYTQSGRTITYNSATSTQLEWNEIYWNNILAKALKYAGVNMDEDGIYKYAEMYNQETK
jgi:hypothetical protein